MYIQFRMWPSEVFIVIFLTRLFCISTFVLLSPSFIVNTNLFIQVGFQAIAEALGMAAVKAAVAITAIIAGGRLVSGIQNWTVKFLISVTVTNM